MDDGHLIVRPIGVIHTPYADRYRAPRQPGEATVGAEGEIVLDADRNFEQALSDLDGFERIWVIYWLHRNTTWKPKVLPPRGPRVRRGVFATRSPHRPNPLGLSLLRLLEVRGRTLRVADVDLLDGTPILDIKPYLPHVEAFPNARAGWLDEAIEQEEFYEIEWRALASEQAEWLKHEHGIVLDDLAEQVLHRDPFPHPYRRVSLRADGALQLAVKSWRLAFHLEDKRVVIDRIESGHSREALDDKDREVDERATHEEYIDRWG